MKKDIVLLSHYDLDGAGCSVVADHVFNVVDRKHQGYGKVRQSLGYLIGLYYKKVDTIVIADLKIEPDDLLLALFAFPNVLYYDHHESSEEFVEWQNTYANQNRLKVHFDLNLCSTALMYEDGVQNLGAERTDKMNAFVNTVNTYDLWKTENKRWPYAVMLNDMFWDLHIDDFRRRFTGGLEGFTENERNWHEQVERHRKEVIESATIEEMESGSKVVVINDSKAINFVSTYLEGDIFYIISPDFSPSNVSVRVKDSDPKFNVNSAIKDLNERHPDKVQSAGGHAAAGGITFLEGLSLNDIVDFLYEEDSTIRGEY